MTNIAHTVDFSSLLSYNNAKEVIFFHAERYHLINEAQSSMYMDEAVRRRIMLRSGANYFNHPAKQYRNGLGIPVHAFFPCELCPGLEQDIK